MQAINYIIKKNLPKAYFGWQFNLWASPGITVSVPSTGIIRLTDSMGISAGRSAIASEAQAIANGLAPPVHAGGHGGGFSVAAAGSIECNITEGWTLSTPGNSCSILAAKRHGLDVTNMGDSGAAPR